MQNSKLGFTLIELLVVISIIGILIGLSAVAYQGTKKSARDGQRRADLEQIRSGLEIYRTDCGSYPTSISFGGQLTGTGVCANNVYLSQVPQDPIPSVYSYRYSSNGITYSLCAYLENGGSSVSGCGGNCGTAACNYKVENP